jgi:hypothetical protein
LEKEIYFSYFNTKSQKPQNLCRVKENLKVFLSSTKYKSLNGKKEKLPKMQQA